jgi:MoxR-like ATPase
VYVDPALIDYSVRLVRATRDTASVGHPELGRFISFGASPRASINLILAGRALAFVRGRDYALPQDVRDLALDVIRHRLVLSYEALAERVSADDILNRLLAAVPLPKVPLNEHSRPVAAGAYRTASDA